MRNILVVVLIILLSSGAYSQTPGYMGKRTSVSLEGFASPSYYTILGKSSSNMDSNLDVFPISAAGRVAIEHSISRKKSIGFVVGPVLAKAYFHDLPDTSGQTTSKKNDHLVSFTNYYSLSGISAGINIKLYSEGWIAPVGQFVKFDFLYNYYSIKEWYKEERFYKYMNMGNSTVHQFGFTTTFGKTRIFKDRIIVSRGIEVGYPVSFLKMVNIKIIDLAATNNSIFSTDLVYSSSSAEEQHKTNSKFWIGGKMFYTFYLSVGVLI